MGGVNGALALKIATEAEKLEHTNATIKPIKASGSAMKA